MNLSISNIAWDAENNPAVYEHMRALGYKGLEIAPTKVFPERPYDKCKEAVEWSDRIHETLGFTVVSMQSIWYGMSQRIAGSPEEQAELYEHTVGAIRFASACDCHNLVFGCPRNRTIISERDERTIEAFMLRIAQVAEKSGVVIALEANPPIYNTNYLNTTRQAVRTLRKLNNPALKLNLDFGTIISNDEDISFLQNHTDLINHVHISEPGLKPLKRRETHRKLRTILDNGGYTGFVSLEMGNPPHMEELYASMEYLKEVFG